MEIKENISLRDLTTLKVGGEARYFCLVKNVKDLSQAREFAESKKLSILILGGGSNILIPDEGFFGLVIKIDFKGIEFVDKDESVRVISGAGENWDSLVEATIQKGFSGLENLSGIPGTVGATPVQNVGAYGVEVKNVINWVETFNLDNGEVKKFYNQDCQFGYRDSFFKTEDGKNLVITKVSYLLERNYQPKLAYKDLAVYFSDSKDPSLGEVRKAVLKIRADKFPDLKKVGTAGSFFKNPIVSQDKFNKLRKKYPDIPGFPVASSDFSSINHKLPTIKLSLAWILDKICGLKGKRDGQVGLFENQPLVLVNFGNATTDEVKGFSNSVKEKVFAQTGIKIDEEVRVI